MLKILHTRLQQYVNCELTDVQAGFRKGRGTRDQITNIHSIIKKAREFQKNIYFCFIDYAKAFDCVDHNKLWKILKEMEILDHLTCLLRNLYAVAQRVKHLLAMQETGVQSLGREDPLKKEMATHSSILAWKIPQTEEPGRLQSMGL